MPILNDLFLSHFHFYQIVQFVRVKHICIVFNVDFVFPYFIVDCFYLIFICFLFFLENYSAFISIFCL